MRISLCMIVKDEAETLRACLDSVITVVDEIIAGVDRTSGDNSLSILKEYGATTYVFDFNDDFATCRNNAIRKCLGDWIFILDGHEFLFPHSAQMIERYLGNLSRDIWVLDCVVKEREKNGRIPCWTQPRIFRNNGEVFYENKVHNAIYTPMKHRKTVPEIEILHAQPPRRFSARLKQRESMNISFYEKELKKNEYDTRALFYIANVYFEKGKWKEAAVYYKRYCEIETESIEERYEVVYRLACCYINLEEDEKAKSVLTQDNFSGVNRCEHYFLLGEIAFKNEQCREAIRWYRIAASFERPRNFYMLNEAVYNYLALERLMYTYDKLKDSERALHLAKDVQRRNPNKDYTSIIEALTKQVEKIKHDRKSKYNIAFFDSLGSFSKEIKDYLNVENSIRSSAQFNFDNMNWCDIAFFEWCDMNIVKATRSEWKNKKIICRLHSYEAFSDFPAMVDWSKVDKVIFVARHIQDYCIGKYNIPKEKSVVIHNGVNLKQFSYSRNGKLTGNKIAYVGYLNYKKGIPLLLDIARKYSEYEFHIAGKFQERDIERYFFEKKSDNVFFHGWQKDINKFLDDKDFIISTSVREGCPINILEAMAKGLTPLIFNWVGAEEFYPPERLFTSVDDFGECIKRKWTSDLSHNLVRQSYNLDEKLKEIKRVLYD